LFGTDVRALWVATGTAANSLALAALCPPHGSILCHRDAHIQNDECGAPEFYTHGAKLLLAEGEGAKLTPDSVQALLATVRNDVHQVQPAALSITNATEYGLVYTPDEVAALGELARERRLGFTWTGRASPMRWHGWAAIPARSPGGPGWMRCRSASSRMADCRPKC
jgi:threonine aldolase